MEFPKPEISFHSNGQTPGNEVFSIVIPSWNNLPYLKQCINSIEKNSSFKHQIIIHVNEGTDGTINWVKQQGYSYTYSATNAGVCYALNAAATLATTKYIVYFNDDMYACPKWDWVLWEAIEQNNSPLFYYSSTMIEYEKGTNNATLSPYDFGKDIDSFDEKALLDFIQNKALKTDWYGASWPPSIVSKELWDKVNGYSEEYSPGFYSDPDFSMKLWQQGVRDFRGFGKSLVYHFKCKSTGRVVRNNGRKTFMKKWGFTASFLYKNVLHVGEPYTNKTLHFPKNIAYFISKLKAILS
ncbi:MAG: glycosyltransferase [Bacteroidia bacterium]|nr:glycosyltransferase [Bacteroidia bacterium]